MHSAALFLNFYILEQKADQFAQRGFQMFLKLWDCCRRMFLGPTGNKSSKIVGKVAAENQQSAALSE